MESTPDSRLVEFRRFNVFDGLPCNKQRDIASIISCIKTSFCIFCAKSFN